MDRRRSQRRSDVEGPCRLIAERQRHDAYEALHGTFGDQTDNVISMLQLGHEQLATKDDLALLRSDFGDLRGDFGDLRGDVDHMRSDFDHMRNDVAQLRSDVSELRTDFGDLRTQVVDLRNEFRVGMAQQGRAFTERMAATQTAFGDKIDVALRQQTRTLLFGVFAAIIMFMLTQTLQGLLS